MIEARPILAGVPGIPEPSAGDTGQASYAGDIGQASYAGKIRPRFAALLAAALPPGEPNAPGDAPQLAPGLSSPPPPAIAETVVAPSLPASPPPTGAPQAALHPALATPLAPGATGNLPGAVTAALFALPAAARNASADTPDDAARDAETAPDRDEATPVGALLSATAVALPLPPQPEPPIPLGNLPAAPLSPLTATISQTSLGSVANGFASLLAPAPAGPDSPISAVPAVVSAFEAAALPASDSPPLPAATVASLPAATVVSLPAATVVSLPAATVATMIPSPPAVPAPPSRPRLPLLRSEDPLPDAAAMERAPALALAPALVLPDRAAAITADPLLRPAAAVPPPLSIASDALGSITVGIDGGPQDLRLRFEAAPHAAGLIAAEVPRLLADLAAHGVRLQSLDIGGQSLNPSFGRQQGQQQHQAPHASPLSAAFVIAPDPRASATSHSDRFA
ncbi:MAG: hypothetical protein RL480_944 [Pseudomonadota bacterium]